MVEEFKSREGDGCPGCEMQLRNLVGKYMYYDAYFDVFIWCILEVCYGNSYQVCLIRRRLGLATACLYAVHNIANAKYITCRTERELAFTNVKITPQILNIFNFHFAKTLFFIFYKMLN